MVVCVTMMSKGSKESLTILIITHVERIKSSVCGFYTTLYSGGSKGGCEGHVPPPWGPKFFQFHAVFGKIWQNCMLAPPWAVGTPSSGKSWIRHCCIQSNVTHLTHVKRVESVLCIKWPLTPPKCAVMAHNIFTHKFLNIQLIFNPKKVLES